MGKSNQSNRWSRNREERFLAELQKTGNVTSATMKAGLARTQVYRRRNVNPHFREKWQNAMDQALDFLEAYLWDKAMGKDMSDNADMVDEKIAIFLLKAHRPEIFGDGKKRHGKSDHNKEASPRNRLLKKLTEMAHRPIEKN